MEIFAHESLDDAQVSEWRAFLETSAHAHPRQDPRFAEVERALGARPIFLTGREAGRLAAAGLFTLRTRRGVFGRLTEALALSGPVCDDPGRMQAFLKGVLKQPALKHADVVRITPYWLDAEADALGPALDAEGWKLSDANAFRDTGLIDLTRSEEELRASFSRSGRRKVRLAEKANIEVRALSAPEEGRAFFAMLNGMLTSRSLSPVPEAEAEAAFEHVFASGDLGVIIGAFHDDVLLGGYLSYRSARTAHGRRYVANVEALKAVNNLRVAPVLWMEGILWAKRQGCKILDVEGWREVTDKSDPQFNVYEYKGEFNPAPARRIGEHSCVINPFACAADAFPRRLKAGLRHLAPDLAKSLTGR